MSYEGFRVDIELDLRQNRPPPVRPSGIFVPFSPERTGGHLERGNGPFRVDPRCQLPPCLPRWPPLLFSAGPTLAGAKPASGHSLRPENHTQQAVVVPVASPVLFRGATHPQGDCPHPTMHQHRDTTGGDITYSTFSPPAWAPPSPSHLRSVSVLRHS